jgi:hypothetical protein
MDRSPIQYHARPFSIIINNDIDGTPSRPRYCCCDDEKNQEEKTAVFSTARHGRISLRGGIMPRKSSTAGGVHQQRIASFSSTDATKSTGQMSSAAHRRHPLEFISIEQ